MVRFLVKLNGEWTPVEYGSIAWNGTLNYRIGEVRGNVREWRLHPETVQSPTFRAALKEGLDAERNSRCGNGFT